MTPARDVRSLASITTYAEAARVFFSRPGPRAIAASAGLSWLARAALGPPGPGELVVAAAVAAWWPVQEHLMHQHLLHMAPKPGGFDPIFARRHRWHHEHPDDVDGTLLPPRVIAAALPVSAAIFVGLFGPRRRALTAMATYSTMALLYEWTHFLVHTGIRPEHGYVKGLRRNHLLHHYRNERYWLGFTAPIVDRMFGTDPDPASVPRSKTAMDLHGLRASAANAPPDADGPP